MNRVALRVVLYEREAYRVPRFCPGVRVVSGEAWLTHAGRDLFLAGGQEAAFAPLRGVAVATVVGRSPLVLEVFAPRRIPWWPDWSARSLLRPATPDELA